MEKNLHSRLVCILLALMLLMQNLAIPLHASGDGIPNYCQYCQETRTIEQIQYIEPVAGAGCTDKGMSEGWKCKICQNFIVEPTPTDPPGHKRQEVAEVPATCTTPGTEAGEKCSVCGEILAGCGTIPATGHSLSDKEAKAATCTEAGWTKYQYCTVCGYKVGYEEIPALEHQKNVTTEAKAATCTENGCTEGWECAREGCGHKVASEVILAKGHTPETDNAVPETCTTDGKTEGSHCSVCGEILKAQETIPAAHQKVEDMEPKDPTCTEAGHKGGKKCTVCNAVVEEPTVLPAEGHTPETDNAVPETCTTDGKTEGSHCSVCGEILKAQETIPAAHQDVVDMDPKDPTCTEDGQEGGTYCTVCGEVVEKPTVLPAHGHKKEVTTPAKAATCTENGCTEGWKCIIEDCGYEVTSEVIKAKGHTEAIIPGWAATCKANGMTEGKKCSVCGTVLTPQYETPKSTVHKFVPAKDTDPNAGPLDNICTVCGEKQVGLSQGDGSAFVSYEQVDPSSGSNGFNLTVGDDYAKNGSAETLSQEISSGNLQVYQGKDGNEENLLCLMSPESTMTHLSFEAGTSGIGKVSIASQNNPTGGATILEPGENVGQFGFGIGSDENGKSYLYIEEDGKEVSFTITKEEDEDGRNRVILTTENGSKITIESDSLLYRVQSWSEYTELSGSQLEVEKTTSTLTTTNESGANSGAIVVEIVFSVKDLGGSEQQPEETKPEETKPEETKPENGIQAIEEQEQTIEELDTGDNSITVLEESEQAKNYVDIIDLSPLGYSEEDWDPENCENNIHWYVNRVCRYCGDECYHRTGKYVDAISPYEHLCRACGTTEAHKMCGLQITYGSTEVTYLCFPGCGYYCVHPSRHYSSGGGCQCDLCGAILIHHWENGICKKCGGKCPHKNLGKNCVCKECGMTVHNFQASPAYDSDSVCARCKARCSNHTFVADGDYCKCTTCGKIQTHYWKFSATPLPNCVCKYCGKTEEHDYDPVTGRCKRCMNECDHTCVPNNYSNCQCTKCGHLVNHKWTEGESSCVCSLCGYKLNHLFSMTWGGTIRYVAEYGKTSCARCGAECKHSFSNCRCTICGLQAEHQWRNGACTICKTACEHSHCNAKSTTECVCYDCGTVLKHDWKKKGFFYECTKCGYLTIKKPK